MDLYIGLMSGTSVDGVDAVVVDFHHDQPAVIATHYTPYAPELREKINALCSSGHDEIVRMGELDNILGKTFANAVSELLLKHSISASNIKAIGSHGQTIRHAPHSTHRFSVQIGDPNIIAALTGITTVADFRRKDIAMGGQGAPLVPAFHQHLFASTETNRAIVNIGGIANVTLLGKEINILGFDTGPGNTLLDHWAQLHLNQTHDEGGAWAKQGQINFQLLEHLLSDTYFQLSAPKSTGREYFNLHWLNQYMAKCKQPLSPVNVQATLAALTAQSIFLAIRKYFAKGEILVCGGGVHNQALMLQLQLIADKNFVVYSTQHYGINPDWVEAIAFAWLARQTINRKPGNLPSVTGAKQAAILGGVYYPG